MELPENRDRDDASRKRFRDNENKTRKTFATLYKMLLQYITAYLYGHQVWIFVLCRPTTEY